MWRQPDSYDGIIIINGSGVETHRVRLSTEDLQLNVVMLMIIEMRSTRLYVLSKIVCPISLEDPNLLLLEEQQKPIAQISHGNRAFMIGLFEMKRNCTTFKNISNKIR